MLTLTRLSKPVNVRPFAGQYEVVTKAASKSKVADAEALASKYEPKVTAAIQSLLDTTADSLDLDALIAALKTGDVGQVLAVVDAAAAQATIKGSLVNALQDAVWGAGAVATAAIGQVPAMRAVEFHFDRLNPTLVQWLKQYDLGLIKQINDGTKESIRNILVAGMNAGKSPLGQATMIKDVVGLTQRQGQAVVNFRKQLETFHGKRSAGSWKLGSLPDKVHGLQVFKPDAEGKPKDGMLVRRLRDFRYDNQLKVAMSSGKPLTPAQIDRMVAAYARKYRAFRAKTIARTESLRATNVGVQEAYRQVIASGHLDESLVRRKWKVAHDERLCNECAPIPGMNPKEGVKFAQPFATPLGPTFLPPLHPNCRCSTWLHIIEPEQVA